ncbi:hypothetical protein JCM3770_004182 [Rhodotorula araucariae]
MASTPAPPPPHPHLASPALWFTGVSAETPDEDIVEILKDCCKLRIFRDEDKGALPPSPDSAQAGVEFESLNRAEKAYATCNGQRLPSSSETLVLSLSPPPCIDPTPLATPRIVKQLPAGYTASKLFALARPFGPLASATLLFSSPSAGGPPRFKHQALLTYYDEEHARAAEHGLHFLEVEGQNIAVQAFDARRAGTARRSDVAGRASMGTQVGNGSSVSASRCGTAHTVGAPAPASYPARLSAGAGESGPSAASSSRPMRRDLSGSSAVSRWSNDGAAPATSPQAKSAPNGIDPCNLFIKSLEPSITTADLRALFAPFGQITSARVMTDPAASHRSKEFGFVSFADEGMARVALREMDARSVRGRRITVRVHEPKGVRARLSAGGTADDGLEEVQTGMESLSTTPNRSPYLASQSTFSAERPVASPSSRRASSTRAVPPRADSPNASEAPEQQSLTEHERLAAAVARLVAEEAQRRRVLALLEGLSKKERALCLFNDEVLKTKVAGALEVLEAEDEPVAEDHEQAALHCGTHLADAPTSLAALAVLPASSIIPLLPSLAPSLGISAAAQADMDATLAFVDSLAGKPPSEVKQKLGERLFKVVKRLAGERGLKGAPRITIELLDSEDLHALAALMHYPEVLGEKVALVARGS